ncbi:MAG TPA: hypothetical protein VGA42_08295 [Gemmatimonadales bacterium]
MIPETAGLPSVAPEPEGRTRFRPTLIRVMTVQLVTLVLLRLLQARYTP